MHKKSAIVRLPFTTLMDKDKKDEAVSNKLEIAFFVSAKKSGKS